MVAENLTQSSKSITIDYNDEHDPRTVIYLPFYNSKVDILLNNFSCINEY